MLVQPFQKNDCLNLQCCFLISKSISKKICICVTKNIKFFMFDHLPIDEHKKYGIFNGNCLIWFFFFIRDSFSQCKFLDYCRCSQKIYLFGKFCHLKNHIYVERYCHSLLLSFIVSKLSFVNNLPIKKYFFRISQFSFTCTAKAIFYAIFQVCRTARCNCEFFWTVRVYQNIELKYLINYTRH